MLKQRVITASVLALIALWVVLKLPAAGFGAALLAVVLLCAWEWADLAGLTQPRGRLLFGGLVLALILAVWPLADRATVVAGLMIPAFAAWCYVLLWLWRYAGQPERQDRPLTVGVAGVAALTAAWLALMGLRNEFGPATCCFC